MDAPRRQELHATVWTFDAVSCGGSLLTDAGQVVLFDRGAFDRSGLRLLRPGQRVRAIIDGDPGAPEGATAAFLTLVTFVASPLT